MIPLNMVLLLESSHPHQKELLINIFELVLINALGRILVYKDLTHLALNKTDCMILQGVFEKAEVPLERLQVAAMQIIDHFKIKGFLREYIVDVLPSIASRIREAIVNQTIDKVFVVFKTSKDDGTIDFKDGVSLSDDDFRAVLEAISRCSKISEKLVIFNSRMHSLKDMIDCLEGACFYEEEYAVLYATLSGIEIALLLKVLGIDDEVCFNLRLQEVSSNKQLTHCWEKALLVFLEAKEERLRQELWQIVERIQMNE